MGIERHQAAFDFGELTEREGSFRIGLGVRAGARGGHRFDDDHVAGHQHVGRAPDAGPQSLVLHPRARPFHFGEGNAPAAAVGKADLGHRPVHPQHHGERPLERSRRRLDALELAAPAQTGLDPRHRPAPPVPAVVGLEPPAQHAVGYLLQARVDGGAHGQPPFVKLVFAVAGGKLAAHLLGEVVGLDEFRLRTGTHEQQGISRLLRLAGRDDAVRLHAPDDPVAARLGGARVFAGVVVIGCLGQRGEERRLGDTQLTERLVEVIERRRRHPVGAEAEIDLVEVELENAVLAEGTLDAEGEDRFLDLAVERQLVGQQEVLRHLLGDGRGADQPAVLSQVAQVGDDGAHDAEQVDARVAEKVLVLGGEDGVDDALGHRLDGDEHALLDGVLGEQPPVAGVHPGSDRGLVIGQLAVIGKPAAELMEDVDRPAGAESGEEHENSEEGDESSQHGSTDRTGGGAPPANSIAHARQCVG